MPHSPRRVRLLAAALLPLLAACGDSYDSFASAMPEYLPPRAEAEAARPAPDGNRDPDPICGAACEPYYN